MMTRAPATTLRKERAFTYPALITFFVVCCTLSLAGCKSGTLTNSEQACKSTGGLFSGKKITCTGSVGVVRGEPSLSVIDADGDLSGNYTLDASISVEKGEAKAYAGEGEEGGKVVPDRPLRISAVVGLDEDDEDVSVDLKVLGKKVENLRYEATVLPQD